jgi:hypothetical protein
MTLLECESIGEHGMTGVVLVLTAGDCLSPRETESTRAIRMYNLASLISLAKWAISDRVGMMRVCSSHYAHHEADDATARFAPPI